MIKTKIPTLDDLLSKVMTQVDAKLRVKKSSINIVGQKEFVPKGSKRFEKKRKFKSHRSDWKSDKRTYVKPNVKVKTKKYFAIIARNHNIKDLNVILFRDLVRINLKVFRNLIFKEINTTIIKLGFWWANSRVIAHTSNIYIAEINYCIS